jgi:hypothetical protein
MAARNAIVLSFVYLALDTAKGQTVKGANKMDQYR